MSHTPPTAAAAAGSSSDTDRERVIIIVPWQDTRDSREVFFVGFCSFSICYVPILYEFIPFLSILVVRCQLTAHIVVANELVNGAQNSDHTDNRLRPPKKNK